VYQLAKGLGVRPSELLGVSDPVGAFHFDRAVTYFGSSVEAALSKAEAESKNQKQSKAKQTMVLNKYLGIRKFRDPATEGSKRVGG
jgi:hypothetical protein